MKKSCLKRYKTDNELHYGVKKWVSNARKAEQLANIAKIVGKYPHIRLNDTWLRIAGHYIVGELIIGVDKNMSVGALFRIKEKLSAEIERKIENVKDITISSEPLA